MTTNLATAMEQQVYIMFENGEDVVLETPDGKELARAPIGSYEAKQLARELREAADRMERISYEDGEDKS